MMSDQARWDEFLAWARRFVTWNHFDTEEREYKLALAADLAKVRSAVLGDDPNWISLLRSTCNSKKNNLTDWHSNQAFLNWCMREPEAARQALTALWSGSGTDEDKVRGFSERTPKGAVGGTYTTFASFLLMALGAESHPMYRSVAYHIAYRLTGYPEQPMIGADAMDGANLYDHAIRFIDMLLAQGRVRGIALRDRLDAQSVLWCITNYKATYEPVTTWPAADQEAFLAYRARGERSSKSSMSDTEQSDTIWMFQFHPDRWDFEEHLRKHGDVEWWAAQQYRERMQIGQRVYFMQSGGRERAGIVAIGRLISRAYPAPKEAKDLYWVDVLFDARVMPPLTRQEMLSTPEFANYRPYAVGQFNTNFPLPPLVAARTAQEIQPRLRPLEVDRPQVGSSDTPLSLEDMERDARNRAMRAVVEREGQPEFREQLLIAYGARCAITGFDAVQALEAAHILPYKGVHTNDVSNGLLLRADLHRLFDLGLLAINAETMTVVLAPSLEMTAYGELAGRQLRLPSQDRARPNGEALAAHRAWADI